MLNTCNKLAALATVACLATTSSLADDLVILAIRRCQTP
jgi:hypothetical protein